MLMFCFKFINSHKFNISSKVMHSNVPSLGDEESPIVLVGYYLR